MSDPGPMSEREELEAMVAWHAAGALSPEEATRLEAAMAADPSLAESYRAAREELAAAVEDNEALGAPSLKAMDALFAKIDAEPAQARHVGARLGARLAAFWDGLSPRTLAWATAAAALVIAVQAAAIGGLAMRSGGGQPQGAAAGYATASAPSNAPAAGPGAYALVRFAAGATSAQITALLQARGAVIVDGPGEGGLYRVRLAAKPVAPAKLDEMVQALQQTKGVEMALPAQ